MLKNGKKCQLYLYTGAFNIWVHIEHFFLFPDKLEMNKSFGIVIILNVKILANI